VIHDRMLDDPIQGQGQGHRGLKCVKLADFKGSLCTTFCKEFCLLRGVDQQFCTGLILCLLLFA